MMKKGITLSSIMLYISMFFVFLSVVMVTQANINRTNRTNLGTIKNIEDYTKLETAFLQSAKQSIQVQNINGVLAFSNGDTYRYENKIIYFNDGIFITNVEEYIINEIGKSSDGAVFFDVSVTTLNYDVSVTRQIIYTLEGSL